MKTSIKKKINRGDFSLLDSGSFCRKGTRKTPEFYKKVLAASLEKNLTPQEIAKKLNIPVNQFYNARSRMRRAFKAGCKDVDDWFAKGYTKVTG